MNMTAYNQKLAEITGTQRRDVFAEVTGTQPEKTLVEMLADKRKAEADLARQTEWEELAANPASCLTRRGPMVGEGDAQQAWRVAQLCR